MHLLDLPNEILSRTISYHDIRSPFDTRLHQKPSLGPRNDGSQPPTSDSVPETAALKSLSSTNRLLRTLTLPMLFRHVWLDPLWLSDFLAFLHEKNLNQRVSSVVALVSGHYNHIHPAWWARLLNEVPATRLSIVAPPPVLAELAGVSSWSTDAWAFDMPLQYLVLDQPREATQHRIDYDNLPPPLEARPWTHLTVNEGSSILAYGTYEYFFRRTPCVLTALLFSNSKAGDALFARLSSFEFVAIFPFYNHVDEVLKCVQKMVNLKTLSIQLCPDPESTLLYDEIKASGGPLDVNDPWNECETSWRLIAHNVAALTRVGKLQELRMADVNVEGVRVSLESTLNRVLRDSWAYDGEGSGRWLRKPISTPPLGDLESLT